MEKSVFIKTDGVRTVLVPPKSPDPLNHREGVMLIGSCFTAHIGELLDTVKFRTNLNPFGIVYHPAAIARQLIRLAEGEVYTMKDLVSRDGRWHSWDHHGQFSGRDPGKCLESINDQLLRSGQFLRTAGHLILTFGSAVAYHLKDSGTVAANCHKFPPDCFETRRHEPGEIFNDLSLAIEQVRVKNPRLRIMFTVSPVRYLNEGAPGNSLSKLSLLRAIELLCERFSHCWYFPSYEIFMDDLRDYRYYDSDMVHPGESGIRYVWDRFRESCFSSESLKIAEAVSPVLRAATHRPDEPEGEAYQVFRQKQVEKIHEITARWPFVDMTREMKLFGD